ncbi:MAG: MmcQ/YjbR family DNA-binding protein [Bacteroidales bacterium]|nr:MmcQ/YjbR family DNA-binding protein [Bacteroidales bacterium]
MTTDIESLRDYCLSLPNATEDMPFGDDTLVFKVGGKIFLLTNLEGPLSINLKCEPEYAITLREEHSSIRPGFHMNKKHWNTVDMDGLLSDKFIIELIIHSYQQVYLTLSKKVKSDLVNER